MDNYLLIAVLGQALGGFCMAVGVMVGLRVALPSLARTLVREMEASRKTAEAAPATANEAGSRPLVTLHSHDETSSA